MKKIIIAFVSVLILLTVSIYSILYTLRNIEIDSVNMKTGTVSVNVCGNIWEYEFFIE